MAVDIRKYVVFAGQGEDAARSALKDAVPPDGSPAEQVEFWQAYYDYIHSFIQDRVAELENPSRCACH